MEIKLFSRKWNSKGRNKFELERNKIDSIANLEDPKFQFVPE